MSASQFLEQLLSAGKSAIQNASSNPAQPQNPVQNSASGQAQPDQAASNSQPSNLIGDLLKSDLLKGAGGGVLATSAINLLLGGKKSQQFSKATLQAGSVAALGMMAYKAFEAWQKTNTASAPAATTPPALFAPQTVNQLSGAQVEERSQGILKAIIAAAKADGHIDTREQQLIDDAVSKLSDSPALKTWVQVELSKPLDPSEVASVSKSVEMAAEMYLASLMVVDQANFMERSYLDELSRQLNIDPQLKVELEKTAQ